MSATDIYVRPYTYELTDHQTGLKYIGVRHANKVSADKDLGIKYFTSSLTVQPLFKVDPTRFTWEITEHETKEEAVEYELQILKDIPDEVMLSDYYNRARGKCAIITEEAKEKLSRERKGVPRNPEVMATLRPIYDSWKGRKLSDDHCKAISKGQTGREHSDETKAKIGAGNKGKTKGRKHTPEAKRKIGLTSLGRKHTPETLAKMSEQRKGVKQPLATCPHCGLEGGKATMKRWHFDNCRHKKD